MGMKLDGPQASTFKPLFNQINSGGETFRDILITVITDLLVVDRGIILKVFNLNKDLVELISRDGATFIPIFSRNGVLLKYVQQAFVQGTLHSEPFDVDDLLYFRAFPKSYSPKGMSIIESLVNEIASVIYASEWFAKATSGEELPLGILHLGEIGQEAYERAKASFEVGPKGTRAEGTKQLRVIDNVDQVQWIALGQDATKLQLAETVRLIERIILRSFGFLPPESAIERSDIMRGVPTRNSSLVDTVAKHLQDHINYQLFYPVHESTKFVFDIRPPMSIPSMALAVRAGLMTPNEGRKELNLPSSDQDGADKLAIFQPFGGFGGPGGGEEEGGEEEKEERPVPPPGGEPTPGNEGEKLRPPSPTKATEEERRGGPIGAEYPYSAHGERCSNGTPQVLERAGDVLGKRREPNIGKLEEDPFFRESLEKRLDLAKDLRAKYRAVFEEARDNIFRSIAGDIAVDRTSLETSLERCRRTYLEKVTHLIDHMDDYRDLVDRNNKTYPPDPEASRAFDEELDWNYINAQLTTMYDKLEALAKTGYDDGLVLGREYADHFLGEDNVPWGQINPHLDQKIFPVYKDNIDYFRHDVMNDFQNYIRKNYEKNMSPERQQSFMDDLSDQAAKAAYQILFFADIVSVLNRFPIISAGKFFSDENPQNPLWFEWVGYKDERCCGRPGTVWHDRGMGCWQFIGQRRVVWEWDVEPLMVKPCCSNCRCDLVRVAGEDQALQSPYLNRKVQLKEVAKSADWTLDKVRKLTGWSDDIIRAIGLNPFLRRMSYTTFLKEVRRDPTVKTHTFNYRSGVLRVNPQYTPAQIQRAVADYLPGVMYRQLSSKFPATFSREVNALLESMRTDAWRGVISKYHPELEGTWSRGVPKAIRKVAKSNPPLALKAWAYHDSESMFKEMFRGMVFDHHNWRSIPQAAAFEELIARWAWEPEEFTKWLAKTRQYIKAPWRSNITVGEVLDQFLDLNPATAARLRELFRKYPALKRRELWTDVDHIDYVGTRNRGRAMTRLIDGRASMIDAFGKPYTAAIRITPYDLEAVHELGHMVYDNTLRLFPRAMQAVTEMYKMSVLDYKARMLPALAYAGRDAEGVAYLDDLLTTVAARKISYKGTSEDVFVRVLENYALPTDWLYGVERALPNGPYFWLRPYALKNTGEFFSELFAHFVTNPAYLRTLSPVAYESMESLMYLVSRATHGQWVRQHSDPFLRRLVEEIATNEALAREVAAEASELAKEVIGKPIPPF
jgi:hypothetical protein